MLNYSDCTVIVPTLNESQNITDLIALACTVLPQINIMVVDDGSTDGTCDVVHSIIKQNSAVVLLDRKTAEVHGLTASVLAAINLVKTSFFAVMDADLQHPPEVLKQFFAALQSGQFELALGTRQKVVGVWPWYRKFTSKLGNLAGSVFLWLFKGQWYSDVLSGFFAGQTKLAQALIKAHYSRFELTGYKVLFDLLKLAPRTLKSREFPYCFNERHRGESKIKSKHLFSYFRSFFR